MNYNPNEIVEVECQQCHKNKVKINKSGVYFGILCSECANRKPYFMEL
jgi:hypothetical protein